jgi:hypothetical protein
MGGQTREQLEAENLVMKSAKEERTISDGKYAMKLVEVVVWGMVALILTSVFIALLALVVPK